MSDSARNIAINIRTVKKVAEETTSPAPQESPLTITVETALSSTTDLEPIATVSVSDGPDSSEVVVPPLSHSTETPLPTPEHHIAQESPRTLRPRRALTPAELGIGRFPRELLEEESRALEGMQMSTLRVGYFCMEVGIKNTMPTYAGGLGILAGDMLKSAADLKVPMIGVTLLHRKGFFRQRLDASGWQFEEEVPWSPESELVKLPHDVTVTLEGRVVHIAGWLYKIKGISGFEVPVLFLDTDLPANAEEDRHITDKLYDSDRRWRLLQETVLGIGGARFLIALGVDQLVKYHMNEGHAALLTLELYHHYLLRAVDDPLREVREHAVFTTHTPVEAGHDRFDRALVESVLGVDYVPENLRDTLFEGNVLNMTRLGFYFSAHINGVAKKHGEVTRELFPGYRIEFVTNGVHAREWTLEPMARLYDRYLPGWQADPHSLRYVLSIPLHELWSAHQEAKHELLTYLNSQYHTDLRQEYFTIGFARRAASYKRANMLFSDIDRLMQIADRSRGIQIIFAGKAHPADNEGKLVIQRVIDNMRKVGHKIRCLYVEDYDMDMGKRLVSGVDLWLNTPTRPQEASGTSGMKAALNGVPQLSVLDGWWLEGHIEGVTGWGIGPHPETGIHGDNDAEDAADMYHKLEHVIIPCFEHDPDEWRRIMRQSVAINGSFFNSHRMLEQYVLGAYFI